MLEEEPEEIALCGQDRSRQSSATNLASPRPCPCASALLKASLQSGTFITKTDGTQTGI